MLHKINEIITEKRLPWFVSSRLDKLKNSYYYYRNISLTHQKKNSETIVFNCGFHGKTGGAIAIANIANILSAKFNIEFVSFPASNYNRLLVDSVKIIEKSDMQADIFLCDVSCNHKIFQTLKNKQKKIIISCHGLPTTSHGLDNDYVNASLQYADLIHFVSKYQQESFSLPSKKNVIIPNVSAKIKKTINTNSVGVVGNLQEKLKNVQESIDIALESNADQIHLWGTDNSQHNCPKIITHPWENDKEKIYNSFDVLVFMSKIETFGLVVAEAMSAGIPCLLSDIPPFKDFALCPGVKIIDQQKRKEAPQILNNLLCNKTELKEKIINYWQENYSDTVILEQWRQLMSIEL